MVHLTLAGRSDDGKRLLLVSDDGVEFSLDIDARLRAALRGEHARLGQLEIQMDSALRPRDIQSRIRSGESPEAVAQAAQTTVDKIMPYAAPVLAERHHVAERAQRSSVRRKTADSAGSPGGARTLGDAVAGHLRPLNVDPQIVDWDAWRREDGRWCLTGDYTTGKRSGSARFTYDAPGNYVTAENDDARWLLGETVAGATPAAPRDDLKAARARRASAPADELPLGDDAIELVTEPDATASLGAEQPVEAFLDDQSDTREQPVVPAEDAEPELGADAGPETEPDTERDEPAERPARKPARKTRGRASVPSWDEIMFGGGKSE